MILQKNICSGGGFLLKFFMKFVETSTINSFVLILKKNNDKA